MTSHGLIFLSLIFSLPSIDAQASSYNKGSSLMKMEKEAGVQNPDSGVTTDLASWKSHLRPSHHHRHAHGILLIAGWGTLLPIGVIIARYFRKFPMECEDWYSLHILCQVSGHLIGTIGWCVGLWLGHSSKQHGFRTQLILSTIVFTFTTIQMFAICLQPKKKCRKCWEIYHHILGYALLALIIANIFQGVKNQSSAAKWKWFYVGELGVLATIAVVLELFRCIKFLRDQGMVLNIRIFSNQ
ncbi:hypothetical protein L1049_010505 [Liquidambar formosana]|uniref:Cytochrome b561 domain-containing protein n=1 Tax=Liquidambar formosana TaxID=63359 RepID=A0AAP0R764_LIQFO